MPQFEECLPHATEVFELVPRMAAPAVVNGPSWASLNREELETMLKEALKAAQGLQDREAAMEREIAVLREQVQTQRIQTIPYKVDLDTADASDGDGADSRDDGASAPDDGADSPDEGPGAPDAAADASDDGADAPRHEMERFRARFDSRANLDAIMARATTRPARTE